MKILILGGTGLISTAITPLLLEAGHDLTLYNRGRSPAHFPGTPKKIRGDRQDLATFEKQLGAAGPFDCIIDMICFSPAEAHSSVRAFGGRTGQYLFCSTVDVYTKPAHAYPIPEDHQRQPSPAFPYAFDKARCEEILQAAHASGAFQLTILRPAQTYGEGGKLVHTLGFGTYFLDRIRRGLSLIVHGDGTSLWSACHRDDVALAFARAVGNTSAYGKAYNVTGEEWLTWDRYYQGLAQAMGAPPPALVHIPTELLCRALPQAAEWCGINFCFDNIFDNRAARQDLGFRYTIPWVEGAHRTIGWLEQQGQIDKSETQPFYDRLLAAWERLGLGLVEDMREGAP